MSDQGTSGDVAEPGFGCTSATGTMRHFPQLMARLDSDAGAAGRRYEDLRRRLILFFRLKSPQDAHDLADEVLDRVARRLSDGVEIRSLEAYVLGVARFVLREHKGRVARAARAHDEIAYLEQTRAPAAAAPSSGEEHLTALDHCLRVLEAEDRTLILTYYGDDGTQRMRVRGDLARTMKISLNALHNRALRLRKQLEQCVARRTQAKGRQP